MNKIIIAIISVVLLCSCTSQPARIVNTISGLPEIEINTQDKSIVKQNIISRNSLKGWALEQETDSSLFFTKVDDTGSMGSIMTQAVLGNEYSTQPKYEARYAISQLNNKIRVVVNIDVSTQMPGGQINRMSLRENNNIFNAVQNQLISVKQDSEK